MQRLTIYISVMIIGFLSMGFTSSTLNASFELKVKVTNLRNNTGVVQFALYNQDGTIPDEDYAKYFQIKNSPISEGAAMVVFDNLPAGDYAVNILHDEDKDGKIKMGWVKPKEGIGFSNFESINPLNKPSFEKAKLTLQENKSITIKMIYL